MRTADHVAEVEGGSPIALAQQGPEPISGVESSLIEQGLDEGVRGPVQLRLVERLGVRLDSPHELSAQGGGLSEMAADFDIGHQHHGYLGRAASKSSCRHLSCVDSAKDELRRGVNMAVLSGASNRQVTLTWAEGGC